MRYRTEIRKDDAGRLTELVIRKGRQTRGVRLDFEYDVEGLVKAVDFSGSKRNMPSIQEILALVNSKFIEQISQVRTISEISPLSVDVVQRPFVGSGKVIFVDDFEATLLKWIVGGGTATRDATYAFSKEASLKLTKGGYDFVTAKRHFAITPKFKSGLEALWSVDDWTIITSLGLYITMYDGNWIYQTGAKYLVSDKTWYYLDENQAWKKIPDSTQAQHYEEKLDVSGAWHRLKLISDWSINKYASLAVNHQLFDLGSYATRRVTSSQESRLFVTLRLDGAVADSPSVWFDDVIVTEE